MNYQNTVEEVFRNVGQPSEIFHPPIWRVAFGAAVMGLFGGLSLTVSLFSDPNDEELAGVIVVGTVALTVAIGMVAYGFRQRKLQACLCPEALVVVNRDGADVFRWDEIVAVRETKLRDSINFIPTGTYRAAEIESADGRIVSFDRNRLRRVGEFIDAVQKEVWLQRSKTADTPKDARLSNLIAAWPELSENIRAKIIKLVEYSDAHQPP